MEWLVDYHFWLSLLSLTALEIVLGIDNIIFIALIIGHLEAQKRNQARIIGISLALVLRIILLFSIVWLMNLNQPWLKFLAWHFSAKDLLMLLGGLFLIYKATDNIHNELVGTKKAHYRKFNGGFMSVIMQIILIDLVFSFDSVITAVGIADRIEVIIIAMIIAMLVMLFCSKYISDFIDRQPTLKILAIAFVMMIGVVLIAEGFSFYIPKAYIYFAMAFSLAVETINILIRQKNRQ